MLLCRLELFSTVCFTKTFLQWKVYYHSWKVLALLVYSFTFSATQFSVIFPWKLLVAAPPSSTSPFLFYSYIFDTGASSMPWPCRAKMQRAAIGKKKRIGGRGAALCRIGIEGRMGCFASLDSHPHCWGKKHMDGILRVLVYSNISSFPCRTCEMDRAQFISAFPLLCWKVSGSLFSAFRLCVSCFYYLLLLRSW